MVALDGVVVTANRNETARRLAPTLVKVVTPKLFDMTNSHTLSQGLVFQPGVRVENDCQNCGYSQVRINGMDGKYTQILIDSPPYLLCTGRCLRSGTNSRQHDRACGSGAWRWLGLFGSSAIAGTVNIITKEPLRNSGSFAHSISNFDGSGSFDNNTTLNLSLVSSDNKMGAYIYGQNRHRSAWDSNGDGFSELPKLKNQTVGINAYYRLNPYSKLNLEYHHMEEFRRGGNRFDLPPHIAEDANLNGSGKPGLVEQIEHSINTGGLKFSAFSRTRNTHSMHTPLPSISCAIVITVPMGIPRTLPAYWVLSISIILISSFFMPSDLTGGVEFNHDNLDDKATDMQKYRDAALAEDPTATGDRLQQLIDKYTPDP